MTLLDDLGLRVRELRRERGLTRRALAVKAKLSERFLSEVESGRGNPSVLSLAQIARALGTTPPALLEGPAGKRAIALLGLRGAGKSAVGRRLAAKLKVPFVELDARIERAAGLSLREIFELHGEPYYRRLEREVLGKVLSENGRSVIATSGGLVTSPETFDLLRRHATTVWLKASPEQHWNRVLAQGDHRPMENDPLAKTRLRELLAEREPLYATADLTVDTTEKSAAAVATQIASAALRRAG